MGACPENWPDPERPAAANKPQPDHIDYSALFRHLLSLSGTAPEGPPERSTKNGFEQPKRVLSGSAMRE
jgi:hypothetical protein